MMDLTATCRNILFGHAIGDALGVPVEFESRATRRADPVREMRDHGTFDQEVGTYSDDFALTACLAESFVESGSARVDIEDVGIRFIKWLRFGYWSAHGSVFDIGIATKAAVERMESGHSAAGAGGKSETSNGNGALMRIAPLVLHPKWQTGTAEERQLLTEQVAGITHGHHRSTLACYIYLCLLDRLLHGSTPGQAYHDVCRHLPPLLTEKLAGEVPHFGRIFDGSLPVLGEDEVRSSGYVVDTLEAAMWTLLSESSYRAVVLKAVNLGYDTDTTACVAGVLASVAYGGEDTIPHEWMNVLARRDDIEDLALRLSTALSI